MGLTTQNFRTFIILLLKLKTCAEIEIIRTGKLNLFDMDIDKDIDYMNYINQVVGLRCQVQYILDVLLVVKLVQLLSIDV